MARTQWKGAAVKPMIHHKRVIVFVASLGSGGAERVAVRVSGWLRDAGHNVCLLTLSSTDTDFYACPDGVQRIGLDLLAPSRGLPGAIVANFRRLRAVRRAVRVHRAQVMVGLGDRSNVLMLLATLGLRVRKLISERADPVRQPLSRGWTLLRWLTYPFASMHVSQSNYVSEWLKQRFPALPCRVIGNAGDAAQEVALEPRRATGGPLRLIAVGRLTRQKGLDLLLDACARALPGCSIPLQLLIVGDGEDRAALQAQVARLGLGDAVQFVGRVHNVHQRLQAADVFVLPSRWEGFPNVMIEAMAVGLPVIAARCRGGVEDILGSEQGQYALDFPPEDTAALADCIIRIAEDAALRQQLARQALVRAADYSPARIAAAWCAAVEQS